MFFLKKKTPEEKAAAQLEKLRRTEGDQGFTAALMHPIDGGLHLADICVVRLAPTAQELAITYHKTRFAIPYPNLRGISFVSEQQIAANEGSISLETMNTLLENGADQFVGPMENKRNARWFMELDYVTTDGQPQSIYALLCSTRGFYVSTCKLYAASQFEIIFSDILSRYRSPDNTSSVH